VLACQYPATRLIQESVQYYTDPPYFASNSIQISQLTDEFLNEVAQSLGDALMSFFRNASRVHRALPKIIALFDQLQAKVKKFIHASYELTP
jgi:hypothetical protein